MITVIRLLAAILILSITSPVAGHAWEWRECLPANNQLNTISGAGDEAVQTWGDGGESLSYNGTEWQSEHYSTWYNFYGSWLYNSTYGFQVMDHGRIIKRDGTSSWSRYGNSQEWFYDVSGSGPNYACAVGWNGTGIAYTYNGTSWSASLSCGIFLIGVWVDSDNDFTVAVGSINTGTSVLNAYHKTGTFWNEIEMDSTAKSGDISTQNAVWGSAGNDVWSVGYSGSAYHWDGSTWTRSETLTDKDLYGVWGRSAHDVFAVGEDGIVIHWDGAAWSVSHNASLGTDLRAVWTAPGARVYAAGGRGILASTAPPPGTATGCALNPSATLAPEALALLVIPPLALIRVKRRHLPHLR